MKAKSLYCRRRCCCCCTLWLGNWIKHFRSFDMNRISSPHRIPDISLFVYLTLSHTLCVHAHASRAEMMIVYRCVSEIFSCSALFFLCILQWQRIQITFDHVWLCGAGGGASASSDARNLIFKTTLFQFIYSVRSFARSFIHSNIIIIIDTRRRWLTHFEQCQ